VVFIDHYGWWGWMMLLYFVISPHVIMEAADLVNSSLLGYGADPTNKS
jgi:hypothetical protein